MSCQNQNSQKKTNQNLLLVLANKAKEKLKKFHKVLNKIKLFQFQKYLQLLELILFLEKVLVQIFQEILQ